VWGFVSDILKDLTRLERGLNEMLEQEKALLYRGPGEDEEVWLKKLAGLEVQEERLLDLYLENKLEVDRYEPRAAPIKQWRKTVEDELAHIKAEAPTRAAHLEQLERDRHALLNHYSRIVPERPDTLEPDERNRVCKLLGLKVLARENGDFEVKWALGGAPCGDNEPLLRSSSASTTNTFRFRALLTGEGIGSLHVIGG